MSKYAGIIDRDKVERMRDLLRSGNEVKQMMTVVGEEGTTIEDFTSMLKSEFFDNVYLQQNAFDPVDAATPEERQQFVFGKVLEVVETDFAFEDKSVARQTMTKATDMFRNWNYVEYESDEYKEILTDIEEFLSSKGQAVREEIRAEKQKAQQDEQQEQTASAE